MLLLGKMLICAAREVLIVTVEMVNYYRVFEKQLGRAGTADETDRGNQQRYRGPLHRAAIRPPFLRFVIYAAKGQNHVNDDCDMRRAHGEHGSRVESCSSVVLGSRFTEGA